MFVIIFVGIISTLLFYNFYWKRRGLPPGPAPLPFFGNMIELALRPPGTDVFFDWRKKYGPVFTYWMGELPMVAFADWDTINETFIKDGDNYTDRSFFKSFYTTLTSMKNVGVVGMEGEEWKEHRKFFIRKLKGKGGSGKDMQESKVMNEIDIMLKNIRNDLDKGIVDFNVAHHIDLVIGSVANTFLFGYSFSGDRASEFADLKERLNNYMSSIYGPASLVVMAHPIPWRYVPFFSGVHANIDLQVTLMIDYFRKQVEEHEKTANLAQNEDDMDFVSAFLKEIEARKGQDGFTREILFAHLLDLWIASQETTTNTMVWGVIFSIHFPEKQAKLQEEFDKVIASSRMITLDDRPNLNYAVAFCMEVQRLANVMPQAIGRRNLKKVSIKGHELEAGTSIMGLMSCVLYDEKIYPKPLEFLPERFLDEQGKVKKADELIPFSAGRRICAGEHLARIEIFLILSNIFHQFKVSPAVNEPLPSMKRNFGLSILPEPFKCSLKSRH